MMEIVACEQGTDEWFRARAGRPTASQFSAILASGRNGGESKTRRSYMLRLAAEIITGEPLESYSNANMERGKVMEAEARDLYAFMKDVSPEQVGFVINGPKGCSPDSFVDANGMLEIKTQRGDLLIETLFKGEFPPEHKAQCQGNLWVAEREWIDIAVYWPKMPLFAKRAHRDDSYIAQLDAAVRQFNDELHEMVERIRKYQS